jgi:hypothetical protein
MTLESTADGEEEVVENNEILISFSECKRRWGWYVSYGLGLLGDNCESRDD